MISLRAWKSTQRNTDLARSPIRRACHRQGLVWPTERCNHQKLFKKKIEYFAKFGLKLLPQGLRKSALISANVASGWFAAISTINWRLWRSFKYLGTSSSSCLGSTISTSSSACDMTCDRLVALERFTGFAIHKFIFIFRHFVQSDSKEIFSNIVFENFGSPENL